LHRLRELRRIGRKMAVILTSNGLTSQIIIDTFAKYFHNGYRKSAIVVTADPEYREKNWNAVKIKNIFDDIGFSTDFFDIEFSQPEQLLIYDVIFFIGGNPFYLLNQIRKTHTDKILYDLIAGNKVVSGSSAGSIVLGTSIALINEFDPQLNNNTGLTDFTGVGLTEINLCPHYTKYLNRYDDFENRICLVEDKYDIKITRISDGEAVIIDNNRAVKI